MRAPTIETATDDWLAELAGHRGTTRRNARSAVARWRVEWGGRRIHRIRDEDVRRYLLAFRETHAASTANLERTELRWFFGHARRRGWITTDPAEIAPRWPEESRDPRTLSPPELDRLLAAAEAALRAMIVLAVETGLRRETLLQLRWEWVDSEGGWVTIPATAMKGRHEYRAPLSRAAMDALAKIQSAPCGRVFPWQRSQFSRRFLILRHRVGVDCRFHDLRRTFFTRARERGVPLEVAMRLSDHRDERTALRHYRSISPEELLKAVGRTTDDLRGAVDA